MPGYPGKSMHISIFRKNAACLSLLQLFDPEIKAGLREYFSKYVDKQPFIW